MGIYIIMLHGSCSSLTEAGVFIALYRFYTSLPTLFQCDAPNVRRLSFSSSSLQLPENLLPYDVSRKRIVTVVLACPVHIIVLCTVTLPLSSTRFKRFLASGVADDDDDASVTSGRSRVFTYVLIIQVSGVFDVLSSDDVNTLDTS